MAILIPLKRVHVDDTHAVYDFFASSGSRGRLMLDRASGDVVLMQDESDEDLTPFTTDRAVMALRKLWERDEYPLDADYRH